MSAARIVAAARGWIGTPYLHQASLKGVGCDCLGLLRGLYRESSMATSPSGRPPTAPTGPRPRGARRWRRPQRAI